MTDNWRFSDPPNVAVIVSASIVRGSAWIAQVTRDAEDGAWQFLDDDPGPRKMADALLLSLREIVEIDEGIADLADLPLGWSAARVAKDAPWTRQPAAS